MPKILIVDNDRDIVESLSIVLKSKGYLVAQALSGEEGYTKALAENPDLIILDVMMETMNKGYEILERLKTNANTKSIPVIMLTAIKELPDMDYTMPESVPDMDDPDISKLKDKIKPDLFYEKPIKPEELLHKIGSLITKH